MSLSLFRHSTKGKPLLMTSRDAPRRQRMTPESSDDDRREAALRGVAMPLEAGPARLVRSAQKDELYRGALKSRAGAVLSGLAGEAPPPSLLPPTKPFLGVLS